MSTSPDQTCKGELKPWEVLASQEVFVAAPWISVALQQIRLPDGNVVTNYHQIKIIDYVVVFAQTVDGDVIVERQYKHGIGRVSLTLPAGGILGGEEPLAAAKRELLEETDYAADAWQELGAFVVDGNYGCGKAHFFKATGARKVATADSGDLEAMEILLMKTEEISAAFLQGEVALLGTATAIALATNSCLLPSGENHSNLGPLKDPAV